MGAWFNSFMSAIGALMAIMLTLAVIVLPMVVWQNRLGFASSVVLFILIAAAFVATLENHIK